jgi:hypothetical protein
VTVRYDRPSDHPGLEEPRVRVLLGLCLVARSIASAIEVVALAQGNPDAARVKNPVAATADSIADGKRIYQRQM